MNFVICFFFTWVLVYLCIMVANYLPNLKCSWGQYENKNTSRQPSVIGLMTFLKTSVIPELLANVAHFHATSHTTK